MPPKKDLTWKVQSKVGDLELSLTHTLSEGKIKVPAGEYDAVIADTDAAAADGPKLNGKVWYVKGIGVVKTTMKVMGMEVVTELDKFEKGK